jgi:hypothetical protein
MMKQFDHMIERKLNLELSNVFPRLSNVFPCLKFLAGCGQFSDFSNKYNKQLKYVIFLDSAVYEKLRIAILNKKIKNGFCQAPPLSQTSCLEGFLRWPTRATQIFR